MKTLAKIFVYIILLFMLCSATGATGNSPVDAQNEQLERLAQVTREAEYLQSYSDKYPSSQVIEDKQGYLWGLGGVGDKTLYRFNGREWQDMNRFFKKNDKRVEKAQVSLINDDILVIVPDGIYKWLGHGFVKYLLPKHERVSPFQISEQLSLRLSKLVIPGTKGYSIFDEEGLSYYPNTHIPTLRQTLVTGARVSYYFGQEQSFRFAGSDNSFWHFAIPNSDPRSANPDFKGVGYYLRIFQKGMQDSLFLCREEEYWNYESGYQRLTLKVLDNYAILGLMGAEYYWMLDMGEKKVEKRQLPEGYRLNRVVSSRSGDRLFVVYCNAKNFSVHEYALSRGELIKNTAASTKMDRDFADYKGVFLITEQEVFNVAMDYWTNISDDYLFLDYKDSGLTRRSYFEFFRNKEFGDQARSMLLGPNLVILDETAGSNALIVQINSFRKNTSEIYKLPAYERDYVRAVFGNEHIVIINSASKLWHLSSQRAVVPNDEQNLFPGLGTGQKSFELLQNTPSVVLVTDQSKKDKSLYIAGANDQYELVSSLPDEYQDMGFGDGHWFYRRLEGVYSAIYAQNIETGIVTKLTSIKSEHEAIRSSEAREAAKKGLRIAYFYTQPSSDFSRKLVGDILLLNQDGKLEAFRGSKLLASHNNSALSDSLNKWFNGCSDSAYEFMHVAKLGFGNGKLWHNKRTYRFDSGADGLEFDVPSFSYEIVTNELRLYPELRILTEINGEIWTVMQDSKDVSKWFLQCLSSKQRILPLPNSCNAEYFEDHSFQLLGGKNAPSIVTKEGLWYLDKDEWIFVPSETYTQAGGVRKLIFANGTIWIIGHQGLCKYSPHTANAFIYDRKDGLPGYIYDAWTLGDRIIVTGSDSYDAPFTINTINVIESGVRVSVPWFEVGAGYYNVKHEPRLKHHQNNIRIPIDILNVSDPSKCSLKYRLQGYDRDFQTRAYTPYLEFRKLKPGRYSLDISAYSPEGYYSEGKKLINFRIVPPLWANTYAYMLYVLLIVGSIYALFRYRTRALALQKLALEETVAQRTSELREKQESMMQSIEYASLIQSSILPLEAELRHVIPRHFIIFRPRDGVSGDFYWLHQEEGHFYLALIDCTGHGVPGALIAVTVNSILNSLVKDRGIKEPKDILTLAHQEIGRLLHQQSSYNQQDGFEIALLRVEPDIRKICFAGAKRPLYLYSEDKMLKIPANRYAIGGLKWHEKLLFTSTTFSYQPQTLLYLFSDGIVDQPHPAYGRKLGSARWLDLLSENATMPIAEQEQSINNLLQQMLEYSDQRDDITIIGLELP